MPGHCLIVNQGCSWSHRYRQNKGEVPRCVSRIQNRYEKQPVRTYVRRASACWRISHFRLLSTKWKQRSLERLASELKGQNGGHGPGSWIRAGWIPGYLNAPGFSRGMCGALQRVPELPQSANKDLRPSRDETWASKRVGVLTPGWDRCVGELALSGPARHPHTAVLTRATQAAPRPHRRLRARRRPLAARGGMAGAGGAVTRPTERP